MDNLKVSPTTPPPPPPQTPLHYNPPPLKAPTHLLTPTKQERYPLPDQRHLGGRGQRVRKPKKRRKRKRKKDLPPTHPPTHPPTVSSSSSSSSTSSGLVPKSSRPASGERSTYTSGKQPTHPPTHTYSSSFKPSPPPTHPPTHPPYRRYIRLKTFVCMLIGLYVGACLSLLSVQFAGLFGLLTFVLNYIPNFGPIVATMLPLPLVLFSPDLSTTAKMLALLLPSLGHFFIGYYLEPRLFGEHLEVHPIIILLSLGKPPPPPPPSPYTHSSHPPTHPTYTAFWSVLWGVSGMILSVPIIASLRIVCQNLDHSYARYVLLPPPPPKKAYPLTLRHYPPPPPQKSLPTLTFVPSTTPPPPHPPTHPPSHIQTQGRRTDHGRPTA